MGLFKKKADPISERSRDLNAKIAALESRIKELNRKLEPADTRRLRSTVYPQGAAAPVRARAPAPNGEPIFEQVDRKQLKEPPEPLGTVGHYNELGARKFDLLAVIERVKRRFRGPPAANPKLITYLAAGNIHGLRPLRYETRVARNRFISLTLVLIVVLFGLFCFLARHH